MGTNPTKALDNVYCKCRKMAALYDDRLNSREGAAELLGISPSSLADYELSITKAVPVDKVILMSDLYNAPELKNYYCANHCLIGKEHIPQIEIVTLDRASLELASLLPKALTIQSMLLEITADGKISKDEQKTLNEILNYLEILDRTYQQLVLWKEKNIG